MLLKVLYFFLLLASCLAQSVPHEKIDTLLRNSITDSTAPEVIATLRAHLEVLHNIQVTDGGSLLDRVTTVVATLGPDPSGHPGGIHHNRTFVILDNEGIEALRLFRLKLPSLKKSRDFPRPRKFYRWKRSHAPFTATAETQIGVPGMFGAIGIRVKNFFTRRETLLGPGAQLQFFAQDSDAKAFKRGGRVFSADSRLVEIDVDIAHRGRFGHDSCVTCTYRTALGFQSGGDLFREKHKLR